MNTCRGDSPSPPKDRFFWHEKLIARACLAGAILTAGVAIYRENKSIAIGYVVFVALGALVVVYDSLCVYCPYPFKYSDCLFYPYQLVARLATMREGSIPRARHAVTVLVFGGMFAIPQYWLWGNWLLLAIFWGLTLPLALLMPLYLCRRCRHKGCLSNRSVGVPLEPEVRHDL
jgi:hypothetical protein